MRARGRHAPLGGSSHRPLRRLISVTAQGPITQLDHAQPSSVNRRAQSRVLPGASPLPRLSSSSSSSSRSPSPLPQIAQYTCLYNADKRAVDCLPFVRTFMQVGRQWTEVTPTVNAGGRLPRGGLLGVPADVEAAQCVLLSSTF